MKKLFLALVAVSTLFLTACSSCLGTTPTPGEAAPQAEAPDDPQSMVRELDSLLKAGNGEQFYAKLVNGMEKMNWATDTDSVRDYGMILHGYVTNHRDEIIALVPNISNPDAKRDLPGFVDLFCDLNMLQSVYGFILPDTDLAENVGDESAVNGNE